MCVVGARGEKWGPGLMEIGDGQKGAHVGPIPKFKVHFLWDSH